MILKPGRGKKTCNNCEIIIGARNKKCPNCSFSFEPPVKMKNTRKNILSKNNNINNEEQQHKNRHIIHTPSGSPLPLKGTTTKEISIWIEKNRKNYIYGYLTTEALCYWIKVLFPAYTKNKDGELVKNDKAERIISKIKKIDANTNNVQLTSP